MLGTLSFGAFCATMPDAGRAQDDTRDAGAVDEIVVTALRRESRLQDVAAAVSAFDAEAMRRLGIHDTESLVRSVPSLSFVPLSPGEAQLALRGLVTSFGLGATVGVYVDETPFEFRTDVLTATPGIELFDVNRIEVLRGPQGTLYGASSLGGTVRYIMNQPSTDGFEGKIELGASTLQEGEEGYSGKAAVNIPVNDRFALRAVGTYEKFPGYIDRHTPTNLADPDPDEPVAEEDYNDTELYHFRLSGLYEAGNGWSVEPSFTYQERESDGMFFSDTNRGPYHTASSIGDEPSSTELMIGKLTLRREFGFGELISSASWLHRDADSAIDYTPLSFNFFGLEGPVVNHNPTKSETFVQEFRLSSSGDSKLGWTAGIYFSDTDQTITEVFEGQELADLTRMLVGDPSVPDSPVAYSFLQTNGDQQLAGFAELSYSVNETVELVAGARLSQLTAEVSNKCTESASSPILCSMDFPPIESDETNVSPRVSLNITPSDELLLYASASRGFRQGGPNIPLPDIPSLPCQLNDFHDPVYESDSVWSYEVGAKTQFRNGLVTANAAVYQVDQEDLQLAVADPGCFVLFFANTGEARTRGAELELSLQPTDGLSFSTQVSYNDAKFVSVPVEFGAAAGFAEGDRVPNVPRWAYSVAGDYRRPLDGEWDFFSRAVWQHVGESAVELGSPSGDDVPAYDIVNAQIGISSERYEVGVFGRNLLDELAILQVDRSIVTTVPGVFEGRNYSAPRSIGVSILARF
jgi:outer membrane receptor protein involved in Fe transport